MLLYAASVFIVMNVCIIFEPESVYADVHDFLHTYETLHSRQLSRHRTRRSIGLRDAREVQFYAFARHFHLFLQVRKDLLSPDFKVYAINEHQQRRRVKVNSNAIYQGVLIGEPGFSEVHAYWEDDKLTATIKISKEIYYIEPSWRHLPASANFSMIVYRESDMKKTDGESFCGAVKADDAEMDEDDDDDDGYNSTHQQYDEASNSRERRQTNSIPPPLKNTCSLLLVADYKFFRMVGQQRLSYATTYLMGLIGRVDITYRTTDFGSGMIRMGFEIKEMWIHENPTDQQGHYNSRVTSWNTKKLLSTFSRDARYQNFCLAHLFTYTVFPTGVLGLAYIANARRTSQGGICSRASRGSWLNTGWSTSINRYGRTMSTREADSVTTHELGHNWGSEHDPFTPECWPTSREGGKFIMYTYALPGYEQNNAFFSPCSKRSMRKVLHAKSYLCFKKKIGKICGNSHVEIGEECDGGSRMIDGLDACCEENCTFRRNAVCSKRNQVCCHQCQFERSGVMCRGDQPMVCEGPSYCTGLDGDCPTPPKKPNGTRCMNNGTCLGGHCTSLCESNDLESCICDSQPAIYCTTCCKDPGNASSLCTPYVSAVGDTLVLPAGTSCLLGYCDNDGRCIKLRVDLIQRLWSIIDNMSPSSLLMFMRSNIVGTVILLSLLVWVPASCVICYVDRKNERDEKLAMEWLHIKNTELTMQADKPRLRRSTTTGKPKMVSFQQGKSNAVEVRKSS